MAVTEIRDHAARENKPIELPALSSLQVNGTAPFWSHPDGARERLDEAYAILMLLQGAHQVCAEVGDEAFLHRPMATAIFDPRQFNPAVGAALIAGR